MSRRRRLERGSGTVPGAAPRPCDIGFVLPWGLFPVFGLDRGNHRVGCSFRTEHCSSRVTLFDLWCVNLWCKTREPPKPQGFASHFLQRRGEAEVWAEGWVLREKPRHGLALPTATLMGSAPRELPQHHPNNAAGTQKQQTLPVLMSKINSQIYIKKKNPNNSQTNKQTNTVYRLRMPQQ